MRKLVLLAALLAATPARAAEAVPLSIEGLARVSDAVVRGTVRSATPILTEDGRRIFTIVELRVGEAWRGDPSDAVRVIVPGGSVGNVTQHVAGAPTFAPGEEVVAFLHRAEAGGFRVSGLAQGKFSVTGLDAEPDLAHVRLVAAETPAGERRAGRVSLVELEQRVRSVP